MKRSALLFFTLFLSISAFAKENSEGVRSFWNDPFNHPMTPLYLVSVFILIVLMLVAFVAIYMIRILNMLTIQAEKEKAQTQGVVYTPRPAWWSRFSQTMNASVP